MQTRWIALLFFVTKIFATGNEIARDYFVYKNILSVVAFVCTNATGNFYLKKLLNKEGITLAIFHPESQFSLEKVMTVNYSHLGVFLDLHCEDRFGDFILSESSKYRFYDETYNWLVFGRSLNESVHRLRDDTFSMVTDLVISTPTLDGYDLYDVYNHAKERAGKLNVTKLASWRQKTGLNITLLQGKYERRANLHGMKLKVISVTQYRREDVRVEDHLQDYNFRPLDGMSKFTYAILMDMADIFNFTMEILETPFWDQIDTDGTHLGMVGILHRSEVDFGATPAVMTKERSILIRIIGLVWPFRTCFMFRSIPTKVSDEFIRPFAPESWMVTGLMLVVCGIVLRLTFRIEFLKNRFDAWNEALFAIIGVMCQQGSTFTPKYLPGRIAIINLLLFSLFIYNYYSASVVSSQLNLPLDKMNDSLHALANSNLELAAEPITYTNYALSTFKDWEVREFYVKRWQPFSDEVRYMDLEEGFERVAKGGFAYHTDPNTGYPYIERLFTDQMICELTEVHLFRPQQMALWGRHNSPFTKMAKIGLARLSSAGLLSRQVKRWASRKPACFRESVTIQSVSMLTAAPAFMILCIGTFMSCFICVLENIMVKYQSPTL